MNINHSLITKTKAFLLITLFIVDVVIVSACIIGMFSSCNNSDEEAETDATEQTPETLTIHATVQKWEDSTTTELQDSATRASYSSVSENSGNKAFSMTFQSGDNIGLFAVDEDGRVVIANQKYTYSGSSWTTENPTEYSASLRTCTFFAYYPWKETLTGAPELDNRPDITSADSFFQTALDEWYPANDQSTQALFSAQDLMIAKGTSSIPYFHEVKVTFTMTHQMGLLVTKTSLPYYDEDDPTDTWNVEQEFTTNIPYINGGYCYYFAKPNVSTTLGTKTTTVQARQIEQLYFTNGEPTKN